QRTPGTRRYWASGAEWAEHARELAERRGTRSKASRDAQAHLAALSPTFLAQQGREDLEAIRAVLLDPRTSSVPPCGQRAGTEYERIINAVNNALAHLNGGDADPVLCAPTRLAELAPTVELAPPTLKLQSPPFPTLRQASLFWPVPCGGRRGDGLLLFVEPLWRVPRLSGGLRRACLVAAFLLATRCVRCVTPRGHWCCHGLGVSFQLPD